MTTSDHCAMCPKPVESTVLAVNAPDTIRHTDGTECAMFSRPPVTLAVGHALAPYVPPEWPTHDAYREEWKLWP